MNVSDPMAFLVGALPGVPAMISVLVVLLVAVLAFGGFGLCISWMGEEVTNDLRRWRFDHCKVGRRADG